MTDPATNPWLAMALNNAWANATLYTTVSKLTEEAFVADRPGFFPSLCRTLNHIYEVDLYYVDALEAGGLGRSVYQRDDIETAGDLARAQSDVDMRFATFCREITPKRLAEQRVTERTAGATHETVAALILHLVQHQVHHRGQAHVQLSDVGIEPPQLDDFYLEFGRVPSAQAYWPAT